MTEARCILQEQRSRKLPKTPDYGGMMMTEDQFEQQQHDSTSKVCCHS